MIELIELIPYLDVDDRPFYLMRLGEWIAGIKRQFSGSLQM